MRTRFALAACAGLLVTGCGGTKPTDAGVTDAPIERYTFDVGFFDAPTIDVPPLQDLGRSFDVMLGPIACVPTTGPGSPETGLGRATFLTELATGPGVQNVALAAGAGLLWSAVGLSATAVVQGAVVSVPAGGAALVITRMDSTGHSPRPAVVSLSQPIAGTVQLDASAAGVTVHLATAGALQVGASTLPATPGTALLWTLQFDVMGTLARASSLAIPTGVSLRRAVVAPGGGLVIDLDTPHPVDFAGGHYDCDGVIVRSNVDSSVRWRRCLSPTRGTIASLDSVTVAPDGAVYVTGVPRNAPDFGAGPDPFDATGGGAFLLRLNPDGGTGWVRHLTRMTARVRATGDGVYLSGTQQGDGARFTFGDRALTACATGARSYVGKFDVAGTALWYSDTGDGGALAGVFGNGDLLMTFAASGGAPTVGPASFPAGTALALARVGPDGHVLRMQSIAPRGGRAATVGLFELVIDADGHPVVPLSVTGGEVAVGALGTLSGATATGYAMLGLNL